MNTGATPSPSAVKAGVLACGLAGIALVVALVLYFGLEPVSAALVAVGWLGLAAMSAVHLVSQFICGLAWRELIIEPPRRALLACVWARWVRDSVGSILAVVPAVGELIAARELTFFGVSLGAAGATTIVDLTAEIVSQLLFTFFGLGLLIVQRPGEGSALWAAAGLLVATLVVGGFIVAQRKGLFEIIEALPGRFGLTQPLETLTESQRINTALQKIYDQPRRVAGSVGLHLVAWIAGALEAWVGLWFMGHPLSLADVLILESLIFALRSAAFIVPWAAGVQEGGYLMLGMVFGLSPEIALALSLLKRAKEIATGVPCLLIWQSFEYRRLWRPPSPLPRAAKRAEAPEPKP